MPAPQANADSATKITLYGLLVAGLTASGGRLIEECPNLLNSVPAVMIAGFGAMVGMYLGKSKPPRVPPPEQ